MSQLHPWLWGPFPTPTAPLCGDLGLGDPDRAPVRDPQGRCAGSAVSALGARARGAPAPPRLLQNRPTPQGTGRPGGPAWRRGLREMPPAAETLASASPTRGCRRPISAEPAAPRGNSRPASAGPHFQGAGRGSPPCQCWRFSALRSPARETRPLDSTPRGPEPQGPWRLPPAEAGRPLTLYGSCPAWGLGSPGRPSAGVPGGPYGERPHSQVGTKAA